MNLKQRIKKHPILTVIIIYILLMVISRFGPVERLTDAISDVFSKIILILFLLGIAIFWLIITFFGGENRQVSQNSNLENASEHENSLSLTVDGIVNDLLTTDPAAYEYYNDELEDMGESFTGVNLNQSDYYDAIRRMEDTYFSVVNFHPDAKSIRMETLINDLYDGVDNGGSFKTSIKILDSIERELSKLK